MNIKECVDHFIYHSPDFHEDLEMLEIDAKHTNILTEAYKQIKNGVAFSKSNFRTWKGQTDLATPTQLSLDAVRTQGLINLVVRYIYAKVFRRTEEKLLLSALLDDIDIIKLLGGEKLLSENPVHVTPGAESFYHINGTSVNFRWLRYIYILKRIIDQNLLSNGDIWVDVGSFYGGLQGLVRKHFPGARIVLVDFHHQLCRSFIYLSSQFPDAKHIMPDELGNYRNLNDMQEGAFMYLPVSDYGRIADQSVNLVTNYFSLGEMRREFYDTYMNSQLFKTSNIVYLVNRFVSAPFFEKTYDTDINILDYKNLDRKVKYFDIFPMHHYLLINRIIFGRMSLRNVSSPYFEMLTTSVNKT